MISTFLKSSSYTLYSISAHYLSDRHNQPSVLGAFMGPDKINEEDEGTDEDQNDSLQESSDFAKPTLSDIDQGTSCDLV